MDEPIRLVNADAQSNYL